MPIYKTDKRKDGKQQYRVFVNATDANGKQKRITKCVYGLSEAKEIEHELQLQARAGTDSQMTLLDLYEEFISVKAHEIRTSSLEKTKSILKNHVLNTDIAKTRIDRLTVPAIQNWKNEISEKPLMVSTKNNAYREFNSMLNYALKMEYISRNPLSVVGTFKEPYFEHEREKLRFYTPDQFRAYIKAAYDSRKTILDHGCYVFFNIAYYTGMRKGEINALKWSDIDGNIIHVRRSIWQKKKGGYEETPPKNKASYRDIQAPQKLLKIISQHQILLQQNFRYSENLRVCGGISPIADTSLEKHNKQYAELAGLPKIRIHDFRHSHASLLCNAGINIQEIARRLGHSKIETTWNTYAHLYPNVEEKAVEILETV